MSADNGRAGIGTRWSAPISSSAFARRRFPVEPSTRLRLQQDLSEGEKVIDHSW